LQRQSRIALSISRREFIKHERRVAVVCTKESSLKMDKKNWKYEINRFDFQMMLNKQKFSGSDSSHWILD
jgi:hypothetical protein